MHMDSLERVNSKATTTIHLSANQIISYIVYCNCLSYFLKAKEMKTRTGVVKILSIIITVFDLNEQQRNNGLDGIYN